MNRISRPAQHARGRPGKAQGMSTQTTTDHDTIRNWTEARGGEPARVKDADGDGNLIRLMFPESEASDSDGLEAIGWDQWFDDFDRSNLALLYQEDTGSGERSRFNKLVQREG